MLYVNRERAESKKNKKLGGGGRGRVSEGGKDGGGREGVWEGRVDL